MNSDKVLVAAVILRFPEEFGLRSFPGKRFRISDRSSYFSESLGVQLVVQVKVGVLWSDFTRCKPIEILGQIARD